MTGWIRVNYQRVSCESTLSNINYNCCLLFLAKTMVFKKSLWCFLLCKSKKSYMFVESDSRQLKGALGFSVVQG